MVTQAGSGFTDTGLDSGETYWYQVIAINEDGDSDPSNPVGATTAETPPIPPEPPVPVPPSAGGTVNRFCPEPWLTDPCDCAVLTGLDADQQTVVNEMAAHMLWKATGSRFGPCPILIRPCRDPTASCGRCGNPCSGCGCDRVYEITLPGPAVEVLNVWVDGELVPPADYRIDDYHWLVNLVGPWPRCQTMAAAHDEAGAFAVEYLIGLPPPAGAGIIQAELACELAKAVCGDASCRLPNAVQSKTRQGVSVNYGTIDPGTVFQQRKWFNTGIPLVDNWLAQVNTRTRPGQVFTPDVPVHRQITWPTGGG